MKPVLINPIIPGFYPDPSICRVGDDFYLVGLRMAEGDFIAHDAVFHGILQGSIQQNLNFLALDESHLDDALAETSVA